MMTVDDVARAALNSVASNAGLLQAIRWASDRYRQLSNRGRLRALRKVVQLNIPPAMESGGTSGAVEGGAATFTRGSAIVEGDATAQAAWAAAGTDLIGRYIRFRRVWYKVVNVELSGSDTVLRLENEVAEDDATDTNYKLVQRHTPMPGDLRFIGGFIQQRLWRPLTKLAIAELDYTQPERVFVAGTGPETWTEIGDGDDGKRLVEFYPYAHSAEAIMLVYYAKSPDLMPGNTLPDDLDIEALKQGVLIDVYRWEMAKALRANQVEQAAVWRNELRAQEKTWEDRMGELMRADRSADDLAVILHTQGPPVQGDMTFIRTAAQDAISRLSNFP